jgi:hypothetical protein
MDDVLDMPWNFPPRLFILRGATVELAAADAAGCCARAGGIRLVQGQTVTGASVTSLLEGGCSGGARACARCSASEEEEELKVVVVEGLHA